LFRASGAVDTSGSRQYNPARQMRMITNTSGADALRATGRRLTRARRIILDVVRASAAHPSAAMVYRDVRRRLPRVSLATVYRNLRMLAAEGLVNQRADAAGMRFDGNTAPHDHFTCVACGRVFDAPASGARACVRLTGHAGFEVLSRRVEFYGRCLRCSQAHRSGNGRSGNTRGTLRGCPSPKEAIHGRS